MADPTVVTCTLTLTRDKVFYKDTLNRDVVKDENLDQDCITYDTASWLATRVEAHRVADHADQALGDYSEQEAKLLGRNLYETIFRGSVRTQFEASLKTADDLKHRVRLELIFDKGTRELARLPWEFLYPAQDKAGAGFIAGRVEKFTLTRFIEQPLEGIPEMATWPVTVLLAVCRQDGLEGGQQDHAEDDLTPLMLVEEIRDLVELLGACQKDGDVRVIGLLDPTFDELKHKVRAESPDIVHIVGEGAPGAILMRREPDAISVDVRQAATARKKLLPVRDVERYRPVPPEELTQMFDGQPPKFVILETCYSDMAGRDGLYSVAESIVGVGVPAVLAMQYDIERGTADKFAHRLYEKLFEGVPIDVAVGEARIRMLSKDVATRSPRRAFGTPVIYLGHGAPLVTPRARDRKQQQSGLDRSGPATKVTRTCPRCSQDCAGKFCSECGVHFFCLQEKCKVELERPMGNFCQECGEENSQPEWRRKLRAVAGGDAYAAGRTRRGKPVI